MTRRNIFITLGAAALALAIAVPVAFSRGPGGGDGHEGRKGMRFERMAEKLGLNAQQVEKLKVLKEAQQDDAQSLREQIHAKREATKALWLAQNPNKQAILAAEREVTALEGQLAETRVEFLFAARQVLTPEQFTQFLEMKSRHGKHGKHGRGGKGGWGKGMRPSPEDSPDVEQ